MTIKQALVYSTMGLMLGFPLSGCGDDDDSGSNDQAGSSSKAGSKSTSGGSSAGGKTSSGGHDDTPEIGGNVSSDGGEPSIDASCDPEGADPVMGKLLNAAVDSDVEVVVKKPQHPGKPGPLELP
jgi:hypothetical protein